MTMLVMRCTSVPLLALSFSLAGRGRHGAARAFPPTVVLLVAAIGVFDVGANLLFAVATVSGALPVVAVLGSLYPAATVLLARVVDHETMSRSQNVGVVAALTGVAMIAAGS